MELRGKEILVLGLARSGLAAARFLYSQGARVTVSDRRPPRELAEACAELPPQVRLRLGEHRLEDFLKSELIILSPGVPLSLPELRQAEKAQIPIWSEVELAYQFLKGTFIGVTGSNGKTTTTILIGEVLKAAGLPCVVAGNIGVPLSLHAGRATDPAAAPVTYVVELSSFQLETIRDFHCHIALILNLTPDHLDRYRDLDQYLNAKKRILLNQTTEDFAVLNADDPRLASIAPQCVSRPFFFSRKRELEQGIFVRKNRIRIHWDDLQLDLMEASDIQIQGSHNLENVLAAAASAFLLGISAAVAARTFRHFKGVEHRLEKVRSLHGIEFYNDSKATNVDSAARALEAFDRPLIVIMGGLDKEGDFTALRPLVREKAKHLILLGKAAEKIAAALADTAPVTRVGSLHEAVEAAYQKASSGDVILLAPACASFDMFENYEHRGRVFKELVWKLNHTTLEAVTS